MYFSVSADWPRLKLKMSFCYLLIIHEEKTKEITLSKRFAFVILIILKFGELLL